MQQILVPFRGLASCISSGNLIRPILTTKRIRPKFFTSSSSTCRQGTKGISAADLNNIKINKDRLMSNIHYTCQWGIGERWGQHPTETGMHRLALSDDDKKVRDWFATTTKELGCQVVIDEMGNMFATRPGLRSGPPTAAGSHLDTQPTGGRYDGILGVMSGIEMLRTLNYYDVETEFPVTVVNWTNEEGARFPTSMVSSGVWAGKIPLSEAYNLAAIDGSGATQRSELERIGYLGSTLASYQKNPLAAHFELHIEQGPILEAGNCKIGVVHGIQAYKWFTIQVTGQACHTGTTPFQARADALLAASKMIIQSHRIATELGGLASTGVLTIPSSSVNVVPGSLTFSLDIRASKDEVVEAIEEKVRESFDAIASGLDIGGLNDNFTTGKPCSVNFSTTTVSPAVHFHNDCIDCIIDSAEGVFGSETEQWTKNQMISGAGHDSAYTSYVCPTAMIFIPCRDGISHNPREYSEPEDCALGAQVLMQSVLRYDRLRAKRSME